MARGDLQIVSTDHAGFFYDDDLNGPRKLGRQKRLGEGNFTLIPNGLPGVEERLNVMYQAGVVDGRISLNRWVELCCTNPAKMFGMYPKKGTIAVGSDADIVVYDPDAAFTYSAETIHMNVDYTAYDGMEISGNWTRCCPAARLSSIRVSTSARRATVSTSGEDRARCSSESHLKGVLRDRRSSRPWMERPARHASTPPDKPDHMDFGVVLQTDPPASRVVELAQLAEANGFSLRLDLRLPCALAGTVCDLLPDAGGDRADDRWADGDESRDPGLDGAGVALRDAQRHVRRPHHLRHGPRRFGAALHREDGRRRW